VAAHSLQLVRLTRSCLFTQFYSFLACSSISSIPFTSSCSIRAMHERATAAAGHQRHARPAPMRARAVRHHGSCGKHCQRCQCSIPAAQRWTHASPRYSSPALTPVLGQRFRHMAYYASWPRPGSALCLVLLPKQQTHLFVVMHLAICASESPAFRNPGLAYRVDRTWVSRILRAKKKKFIVPAVGCWHNKLNAVTSTESIGARTRV
jgi:hypothetical protein